jgi:hypothetical protein
MFGYWENKAEEKFNLTGWGKTNNRFQFGPVHNLRKSQLLVRLDFLAQTRPDLYTLPLSYNGGPVMVLVILALSVVLHHIWILIWSDFEWRRPKNPRKIPQEKLQGPAS